MPVFFELFTKVSVISLEGVPGYAATSCTPASMAPRAIASLPSMKRVAPGASEVKVTSATLFKIVLLTRKFRPDCYAREITSVLQRKGRRKRIHFYIYFTRLQARLANKLTIKEC
jgi:hypothetical protein